MEIELNNFRNFMLGVEVVEAFDENDKPILLGRIGLLIITINFLLKG